jgi:hypothetical protein
LALGIDQGKRRNARGARERRRRHRRLPPRRRSRARVRRDGSIVQDAEGSPNRFIRAAEPIVEGRSDISRGGPAVQRSSLVVWRRSDARPVTPVLSWRAGTPYEPSAELLRVRRPDRKATGSRSASRRRGRLAALSRRGAGDRAQLADGDSRGVRWAPSSPAAPRRSAARSRSATLCSRSATLSPIDLDHGTFHEGARTPSSAVPQRAWANRRRYRRVRAKRGGALKLEAGSRDPAVSPSRCDVRRQRARSRSLATERSERRRAMIASARAASSSSRPARHETTLPALN